MPDFIPDEYGIFDRHPVPNWIQGLAPDPDPGFAGMTILGYLIARVITQEDRKSFWRFNAFHDGTARGKRRTAVEQSDVFLDHVGIEFF